MNRQTGSYPSKTTLNLAMREKSSFRPTRSVPLFLCLAAVVLLFAKFAVADRLGQVMEAQRQVDELNQQVAALETETEEYYTLLDTYNRYSVGWMTEEELAAVSRVDMLDLVEDELMPAGRVAQLSVSGNLISLQLMGVDLEDTSRLVNRLYQSPQVSSVAVYTATTQQDAASQPGVSMIITMAQAEEGGAAE